MFALEAGVAVLGQDEDGVVHPSVWIMVVLPGQRQVMTGPLSLAHGYVDFLGSTVPGPLHP